jgi:bifunctional UDP-N-acetylglucosamine pyrophosphorylase/glucosamine-1-phosphate N-acetyltransferase
MSQPVVLVLAGGASNRFWPLRDKPLLEFGSASLIERHLRMLQSQGCGRFVIVVRPETKERVSALLETAGIDAQVADQEEAKGMADAVLSARRFLDDEPLYITQAQDIVDGRLHESMLSAWAKRATDVSGLLAAAKVESYFPGGYLMLDGDRVTGVIEKPGAGNEPSNVVNIVAHIFSSSRDLMGQLERESAVPGSDDAYERALTGLMAERDLRAVVYEGRWQALKYPWHVLDVMDLLLERWAAGEESPGDGYEEREPGVFIGRDVRIFPGSHVVAPALIGHGVVIGHNSLVRGSLIGPRCVIGFGSEVARSYLAEGVELHHNYVGDSVFDRETSMGYGAVTANFRLDGRTVPMFVGRERMDTGRGKLGLIFGAGSKLGVNTSTMPGVKIGAGSIIGPNMRVTRDVPDGERMLDERRDGRV